MKKAATAAAITATTTGTTIAAMMAFECPLVAFCCPVVEEVEVVDTVRAVVELRWVDVVLEVARVVEPFVVARVVVEVLWVVGPVVMLSVVEDVLVVVDDTTGGMQPEIGMIGAVLCTDQFDISNPSFIHTALPSNVVVFTSVSTWIEYPFPAK